MTLDLYTCINFGIISNCTNATACPSFALGKGIALWYVIDPKHWVFSKADGVICRVVYILQDQDLITSLFRLVIDAARDTIPRAITIPKSLTLGWSAGICWRPCGPWAGNPQAQANSGTEPMIIWPENRESWTKHASTVSTKTPIGHVWNRVRNISGKISAHPSSIKMGRMLHPSATPWVLLTSMQLQAQTTLLTKVQDSWPLRSRMTRSEISWITSGPQETSHISAGQQLWPPSPNQTRNKLTQSVADQSYRSVACARS